MTKLTIRRAVAATVLVGGLIVGAAGPAQATAPASTADGHQAAAAGCTSSPSADVWTQIAWQIFDLINQQRAQNGVGALQADQGVSDVAIAHSIRMGDTGIFSHVIDGKGPEDRLRDHGVAFTSWGENISNDWCQSNGKPAWNVDGFAQDSVNRWMNSPGHRQNILNASFNLTGVGIAARARDNRGYIYTTQVFIQR